MTDRVPEREKGNDPVGAVMVVGAGIAGMQSSLDLAEMGFKVYLVEAKPSIGGVVPQLDKTFPTNDCAMCILAPKLVETGRHPNIEILVNSVVDKLDGEPGHFKARIRRRALFIDPKRCNGCGECVLSCPVELPSEHDEGLITRKAIYRRYPQAIPNTFAIDKRGISPCRTACPAGINVHGYVALIRAGKFAEAYRLITKSLPFPGVCGRACHHPCESICNRKDVDDAISIRNLKRFVADYVAEHGLPPEVKPQPKAEPRPEKIAIIGAGPAGLTAGKELARKGYGVTIFDSAPKAGGMMSLGIPAYRMPRTMTDKEIEKIVAEGVTIELGRPMDSAAIEGLLSQGYAAVLIAIGAHKGHKIPLPGADHPQVLEAIHFLREVNLGNPVIVGKRVVVVGGGNVSIDVARVAKRLGAEEVSLVCLEMRRQMPAHIWEQQEALEEGIQFITGRGPHRVVVEEGKIVGLETLACRSVFDQDGFFKPDLAQGTEALTPGDTIILAVGQAVDTSPFVGLVETDPRGRVKVDSVTMQTSRPEIFSAGDVVTGPASVVGAVGQGKAAAESIHRFLNKADLKEGRGPIDIEKAKARADYRIKKPRLEPGAEDPAERVKDWREIERAFSEEEARAEAARCLNCAGCSECLQCVATCKREAIRHEDQDLFAEVEVGAVLLSPGFEKWDPSEKLGYGYGLSPNVITSPEFERILSASGPYGGHLRRPSDGRKPMKIAFLQCVGSRDSAAGCSYCSSVCCMYATKEAVIAIEHERDVTCHIYYMDLRAYGKGFEKYYRRAQEEYKVDFRRNRVAGVQPLANNDLELKFIGPDGKVHAETYDLVVLAVGMRPSKTLPELSRTLGIDLGPEGFLATGVFQKENTTRGGIYAAGAATEPMDIPETVSRASSAAGAVAELLAPARGTLVTIKEFPAERDVSSEEPRIGVFVCACGINIGGVVDVHAVAEYARTFPGVSYSEVNLYTCSQDTQENIKKKIEELGLNRVLVASCTPRTHESLFQNTISEVGVNPYLFEFVSLREQVSWVHNQDKQAATEKAKVLVAMGLARCGSLTQLVKESFPVTAAALVVGGGATGMTAALSLADQGYPVHLIELSTGLGGHGARLTGSIEGEDVKAFVGGLIARVTAHPKITVHYDSTVTGLAGYVGNYVITLRSGEGVHSQVQAGAIVVATGGREIKPQTYGYGDLPEVVTQMDLEQTLDTGEVKKLKDVVMIQCVGSRDATHPYCSRVCCTQAIKNALRLKKANPKIRITILYRDIRTYGFRERYYQEAREAGILFLRYETARPPQVAKGEKRLTVAAHDEILNRDILIPADLVVLSVGIEPTENMLLSQVLKVPLDGDGFFLEAHAKLRPLEFATDGVFLAGLAHSPKLLFEAVSQARGAAAKAAALLSKSTIKASGRPVAVVPRNCSGCGLCVAVCPFEARRINEETGRAEVIQVLCQGCGACAVACLNASTRHTGFEKNQILAQIDAALM